VGGTANIPIERGNLGLSLANSLVLTATLSPGLTYTSDDAGVAPLQIGNTVVWLLPALSFSNHPNFNLRVHAPNAALGTLYSVTWTITSLGVEFDPSNNTDTALVRIALLSFLPLIDK